MKAIHHVWNKITDQHRLKHAKCERCKCQKWWDAGFKRLIYIDRFGNLHYKTPSCVLPNTFL
jgi:hypothetical protein